MAGLRPAWILAIVLTLSSRANASVIHGTDPPFTLTIPDRFGALGDTLPGAYAFADRGGLASSGVVVTLRPMPGMLANEPITEAQARAALGAMTPGARVRVVTLDALGVDVPVVLADTPGADAVAVAMIPTAPRALQLTVSGPSRESPEIERTTREIVASLHARTNWLTRAEIARRRAGRIALAAAWALVIAYGIAYLVWFRKARARGPEAAWLGTSGALFLVASALLASVPKGASAFAPLTPALVALVLIANAVAVARRPGASKA